jgi:adenine/guanine/hypoxanthine permease
MTLISLEQLTNERADRMKTTASERWFGLQKNGTRLRTEFFAGLTTFLTMSYIIFVQPAMLSGQMFGIDTGMDFRGVFAATCLASAVASIAMGLLANYPIALAPGMGINAYFALTLLPAIAATGHPHPWQVGLGVVLVSGILFLTLTLLGIREQLFDVLSPSLKSAIAVGIGIFIAFIGMKNGGLLVAHPATLVTMNHTVYAPDIVVFLCGLLYGGGLLLRGSHLAVLGAIAASAFTAILFRLIVSYVPAWGEATWIQESLLLQKVTWPTSWWNSFPSVLPTLFKFDIVPVFDFRIIPFVAVFLFIDMFDTIGTLVGVTQQAGILKDGKLPRVGRAMAADAIGTIVGACLGTSTVTSYIESAAGVQAGGRTGLTAIVVAFFFLLAMFLAPLVEFIGAYPPLTAAALVLVGAMMAQNVKEIDWQDNGERLPAFLVMIAIPLTFSIGDGIAIGIIAHTGIRCFAGRFRTVRPASGILAGILVLYFLFVRSRV